MHKLTASPTGPPSESWAFGALPSVIKYERYVKAVPVHDLTLVLPNVGRIPERFMENG